MNEPIELCAGDRISVRARFARDGELGLTYPACSGVLLEDAGTSEGWDVVDIREDDGSERSIYCFSIER